MVDSTEVHFSKFVDLFDELVAHLLEVVAQVVAPFAATDYFLFNLVVDLVLFPTL